MEFKKLRIALGTFVISLCCILILNTPNAYAESDGEEVVETWQFDFDVEPDEEGDYYQSKEFTVNEAGLYYISRDTDGGNYDYYGWISDQNSEEIVGHWIYPHEFNLLCFLEENTTYRFSVRSDLGKNDCQFFLVNAHPSTLELNEQQTMPRKNSVQNTWFKFVVPETEYYDVNVTGEHLWCYSKEYYIAENGRCLYEDNGWDGEAWQAGTVYYICAVADVSDYENAGMEYSIMISKAPKPVEIKLSLPKHEFIAFKDWSIAWGEIEVKWSDETEDGCWASGLIGNGRHFSIIIRDKSGKTYDGRSTLPPGEYEVVCTDGTNISNVENITVVEGASSIPITWNETIELTEKDILEDDVDKSCYRLYHYVVPKGCAGRYDIGVYSVDQIIVYEKMDGLYSQLYDFSSWGGWWDAETCDYRTDMQLKEGATYYFVIFGSEGAMVEFLTDIEITEDEPLEKHQHSYTGNITTKATCTTDGTLTYICECGDSYTEPIKATGHSYDGGIVTTAATCTTDGVKTYTCSNCHETYTEPIKATGHSYDGGVVTTAATCTTDGVKTYTCSNCHETYTEPIKATGHAFGEWELTKEPTALDNGEETRTCANCGEKEIRELEKLKPTIKLNTTAITLKTKQSTTAVEVTGLAKGDGIKSWKSSNTAIVKVDTKGKITAQSKAGKVYVTVTLKSGLSKTITVTVQKAVVKCTKVTLNKKTLTLKKGKTFQLIVTVTPITCVQKIEYKSSNSKIVSVTSKGKLKALKKGTATITVTVGKKKATCKVMVK